MSSPPRLAATGHSLPEEPAAERPMFADVGRRRQSAESNRSPSFMLLIVVGVLAAVLAFYGEQRRRASLVIVEVTYAPPSAEAPEASPGGTPAPEALRGEGTRTPAP